MTPPVVAYIKGSFSAPRPTIGEVIEEIGMGRAQIVTLLTGGVVLFNRGIQMCLMSMLTIPVAQSFHIGTTSESHLSTVMFVGMFFGTIASGQLGDRIGRRLPVCVSCLAVALLSAASALSPNFGTLLALRSILGFFMAFGDVPVTALISEMTPKKWRIPMRAAAESIFDVGYTYAAFIATLHDPLLHDIPWRRLLIMASLPPGIIGICTVFLLPESPVYLASSGQREAAQRIFASMRRMNGRPHARINYEPQPHDAQTLSAMKQARIIFGPRYLKLTLILAYATFIVNFFYYGGMYTQPQVMTKGHGLLPGWEIVLGGPADMFGILAACFVAQWLPRKVVLTFALFMAAAGTFCYGYAGYASSSLNQHSWSLEVLYHFGVFGFYWVPAMTFIVLGQLSVESFPTVASTSGGSVAFAAGRLGALSAPMLFEHVRQKSGGRWNLFCYVSAAGCIVGSLMFAFIFETAPEDNDAYEAPPDRVPLAASEEGNWSKEASIDKIVADKVM